MFATSAEQRAGLLVAVITGGRPALKQRPTARLLDELKGSGFSNITWVLSDQDADRYEADHHPFTVYPREWALDYASRHWMLPEPVSAGSFLGAFTGREAACREAERRGCWGVLQLDDNIMRLMLSRSSKASAQAVREAGGLALFADLLAAGALATNARMVGAQLSAVQRSTSIALIRPGFPYSLFIERVGDGREPWYGPYEDDITHAFQYGDRADGATAAVMDGISYTKESKSTTGMRAKYDHTRSKQLQRLMPQGAKVGVRASKSNGLGGPRVFHTMTNKAIRNPIRVHDPHLIDQAGDHLRSIYKNFFAMEREYAEAKTRARIEKMSHPSI